MDDRTLSLDEIRADFVLANMRGYDEFTAGVAYSEMERRYQDKFNRALAAHDAAVLRRAADELGVYVGDEDSDYWTGYRDGQRRQINALESLAIEQGDEGR